MGEAVRVMLDPLREFVDDHSIILWLGVISSKSYDEAKRFLYSIKDQDLVDSVRDRSFPIGDGRNFTISEVLNAKD